MCNMKRSLSGIKPTGNLTLGNYIGALRGFKKVQDEYESFVFIADLHALTLYCRILFSSWLRYIKNNYFSSK